MRGWLAREFPARREERVGDEVQGIEGFGRGMGEKGGSAVEGCGAVVARVVEGGEGEDEAV